LIAIFYTAVLIPTVGSAQQHSRPDNSRFIANYQEASPVRSETLLSSSSSWDGTLYEAYSPGRPQVSVLRITIAPHWHSHPMPNTAYVLSGEITVEKEDGTSRRFKSGEVIAELVDGVHRGVAGDDPVVLIVFYAGTTGRPLSQPETKKVQRGLK
jgi:quercetin dioxygenase-like cupin family protein